MPVARAEPGKTRIGWMGTGVMGRWMCQHLMTRGYTATVYNRTKEKAQDLIAQGAAWAPSPRALAEKSDVVLAIVGFPRDVREVFLGPDGALAGSKPRRLDDRRRSHCRDRSKRGGGIGVMRCSRGGNPRRLHQLLRKPLRGLD